MGRGAWRAMSMRWVFVCACMFFVFCDVFWTECVLALACADDLPGF